MARLERRRRNPKKYQEIMQNLVIIQNTKIVQIEEKNKEFPNTKKKYKNVFYCESIQSNEPKLCIHWGYLTISIGDVVSLVGYKKDNTFICTRLQIIKKGGQSGS